MNAVILQQRKYRQKVNETLYDTWIETTRNIAEATNKSLFHSIIQEHNKILQHFYNSANSQLNWTTANNLLRERDQALANRDNCTQTITTLSDILKNIASQCVLNERIKMYIEQCEKEINLNRDLLHNSITQFGKLYSIKKNAIMT